MARTVELDEDVYQELLQHIRDFGDTPSSVLRRILSGQENSTNRVSTGFTNFAGEGAFSAIANQISRLKTATDRYLCILAFAHSLKQEKFHQICTSQTNKRRGGKRVYFARTEQEILESGSSTNPKKIANSPYWALTNLDTAHKQSILSDALGQLGFEQTDIDTAVGWLN